MGREGIPEESPALAYFQPVFEGHSWLSQDGQSLALRGGSAMQ